MTGMEKIAVLQRDEEFLSLLRRIEESERDRIFCRHGLTHLLDSARIAWIDVLENRLPLDKPVVYAAALLHDLGRAYGQTDHSAAALDACRRILLRSGFDSGEAEEILLAIRSHGEKSAPDDELSLLSAVIRRADGRSRPCYACPAAGECYWPDARRNHSITV